MKIEIRTAFLVLVLSLFWVKGVQAQQTSAVTGRIFSAQDSLPLPGATVKVMDSNQLTVTDQNGRFSLASIDPESV